MNRYIQSYRVDVPRVFCAVSGGTCLRESTATDDTPTCEDPLQQASYGAASGTSLVLSARERHVKLQEVHERDSSEAFEMTRPLPWFLGSSHWLSLSSLARMVIVSTWSVLLLSERQRADNLLFTFITLTILEIVQRMSVVEGLFEVLCTGSSVDDCCSFRLCDLPLSRFCDFPLFADRAWKSISFLFCANPSRSTNCNLPAAVFSSSRAGAASSVLVPRDAVSVSGRCDSRTFSTIFPRHCAASANHLAERTFWLMVYLNRLQSLVAVMRTLSSQR